MHTSVTILMATYFYSSVIVCHVGEVQESSVVCVCQGKGHMLGDGKCHILPKP